MSKTDVKRNQGHCFSRNFVAVGIQVLQTSMLLNGAFVSLFMQDVILRVAILEFIATAVETQPGLIELFLDLICKDNQVCSLRPSN